MDIKAIIEKLLDKYAKERTIKLVELPARKARYKDPREPLPEILKKALGKLGIERLYTHQAEAWDAIKEAKNVLITTSTASGKTLIYNLPVIDAIVNNTSATALYIFPTKALAQDQLRALNALICSIFSEDNRTNQHAAKIQAATYDGDTPSSKRTQIRKQANIILTNPDMLHYSVLPYHARWARFFQNLRFIVIDELHTYRGIFGSHVANLMRRLNRILDFHGSRPQYILTSATIGNPEELARKLTGKDFVLIDNDGSPSGRKYFIFWGTKPKVGIQNRYTSSNTEATSILSELIRYNHKIICFVRARILAELIYKYTCQHLENEDLKYITEYIRPYRSGYLAEERRNIEKMLFEGKLRAIIATTALELGIDVGSIDIAMIVGYPGSISSFWQQAGRAGRKTQESLVILIGYENPTDQYIIHNPDYLFSRDAENILINPHNTNILFSHLLCAAQEMPLTEKDSAYFEMDLSPLIEKAAKEEQLYRIDKTLHWARDIIPATTVNLRSSTADTYSIIDIETNQTIGTVDATSAFRLIHPGAIYWHEGQSYIVNSLDIESRICLVKKKDTDYFTQPITPSTIEILGKETTKRINSSSIAEFGRLKVITKTSAYKRIRLYTLETIGIEELDLPEERLLTEGLWISFNPIEITFLIESYYKAQEKNVIEDIIEDIQDRDIQDRNNTLAGICGLVNPLTSAIMILANCDTNDIASTIKLYPDQVMIVVYDLWPEGLGFARIGFENIKKALKLAYKIVDECPCDSGCPSCVGLEEFFEGISPQKKLTKLILQWITENEKESRRPR